MIFIEVIGLDPPCEKCTELLHNVTQAVEMTGIEARIEKKLTLSPEIMERYGLLLSPALVLDGVVIAQGKVYRTNRIVGLLQV
jgi:hypothetical protein